MNNELIEELSYEIAIRVDSGFFKSDEILQIMEDLFWDEDISFDVVNEIISDKYNEKIAIEKNFEKPTDFDRLKTSFNEITKEGIVAIHNGGYTLSEGIEDAFEVFYHLKTKNRIPEGFCFYHFQDIERAIEFDSLNIAFGDFENDEEKSLAIGSKIATILINKGFSVNWNEDINTRIEIKPFKWEKSFDDEEYEMEGAFNSFLKNYK